MTDFITEYVEAIEEAKEENQKIQASINAQKHSIKKIRRR